MGSAISFYVLASIITCLSIAVITVQKPVVAVALLVFNLFFLAGVYALLGADFVAVIQVIIYAGAILVLFMFVIMLLNAELESKKFKIKPKSLAAFGLILIGFLFLGLRFFKGNSEAPRASAIVHDNTYEIGIRLFEHYVWPFEIASFLILLGIVAAILISKKPSQTQNNS